MGLYCELSAGKSRYSKCLLFGELVRPSSRFHYFATLLKVRELSIDLSRIYANGEDLKWLDMGVSLLGSLCFCQ